MHDRLRVPDADFRLLFEKSPAPFLVLLPDDFTIVEVNDAYLRATNAQREQLIGQRIFNAFPDNADDPAATAAAHLRASLERTVATKAPQRMAFQRYDVPRPQGGFEERYWSPVNVPVLSGEGKLLYVIHRVEDVTEFVHFARSGEQERNPAQTLQSRNEEMAAELLSRSQELHRANAQLSQIEERYRLIGRATNDIIWDWNLETDQVEWSDAVFFHLGYTPQELGPTSEGWRVNIHPEDRDWVLNSIHTAIDTGEDTWTGEYRFRHSDGTYATFLDRGHIARDPSGRAYRMIGSMLNVTERRRMEEALRRAAVLNAFRVDLDNALRPLADPVEVQAVAAQVLGEHLHASRVLYAEISPDGEYALVHADYCRGVVSIVGRHRLADFGRTLIAEATAGRTLVVEDVAEDSRFGTSERGAAAAIGAAAYAVVPLIKAGRPVALFVVHQSEPRAWTAAEVALMEETAERTWAAVERARAEEALRASEERFRALVAQATVGIALTANRRLTYVNDRFCELVGRSREELIGQTVASITHPDEAARDMELLRRMYETGESFVVDKRYVRPDGSITWALNSVTPLRDREDRIVGGFAACIDVTDRKRAEAALHEADRRKDEFLAMLAHELRNPLAAIHNATRLLEKASVEPGTGRYVEILRRQAETLGGLVDDLLDVSRITRGLVELNRERVDLAAVAQRALESVQPLLDEKRHEVNVTLPREAVQVIGDPVRLEQVLGNLLTNAAKYTDPGGQIELFVEREGDSAQLGVRDNGIGMTPEVIESAFTLFGQAERGLARSEGGLGIGLTIVKSLVELHGGSVSAHSAGTGQGSEFIVRLPLAPAEAEVAPAGVERRASGGKAKRILVVDDNVDIAETLALLLEDSGHEVSVAHDGPGALARAEEFVPELILLDIGLPGMDGYEVAKQLRRTPRVGGAVLVALTGYGQARDREQAQAAGFDRHFVKPVDIDALEAFVNEAKPRAQAT